LLAAALPRRSRPIIDTVKRENASGNRVPVAAAPGAQQKATVNLQKKIEKKSKKSSRQPRRRSGPSPAGFLKAEAHSGAFLSTLSRRHYRRT